MLIHLVSEYRQRILHGSWIFGMYLRKVKNLDSASQVCQAPIGKIHPGQDTREIWSADVEMCGKRSLQCVSWLPHDSCIHGVAWQAIVWVGWSIPTTLLTYSMRNLNKVVR